MSVEEKSDKTPKESRSKATSMDVAMANLIVLATALPLLHAQNALNGRVLLEMIDLAGSEHFNKPEYTQLAKTIEKLLEPLRHAVSEEKKTTDGEQKSEGEEDVGTNGRPEAS